MKKVLFITVGTLVAGVLLWYSFLYFATYSEGVRAGELIKISRKGVLCKTWEGEMSQGISGAQIFTFSVLDSDKDVILQLQELQGQYVKVNYKERYRTFPWWGDTHYFITDVSAEKSPFQSK